MIHVVIPVYKGLAETKRCIDSVLEARNQQIHRITIIDDCSPEAELVNYLRALANVEPIELLRNSSNEGFVATVNRGMQLEPGADVILLNSDTVVSGNWIDRLYRCAYSSPKVGTVTPFSNNATICSYPKFCEDNPLPDGWNTTSLDSLFSRFNAGKAVELPTAIGFCMYIKRSCLVEVGLFDIESFGKGYGEENDFCMRARILGWRHMLCTDTFVYHTGGVSFASEQSSRKAQAISILSRRHPQYKPLIALHLNSDPSRPFRLLIDFARITARQRPVLLFITHKRGGGTERHIHELSNHFNHDAEILVLRPYLRKIVALEWLRSGEQFRLFFNIEKDYSVLLRILELVGICQIHYHHLFGHSPKVRRIAKDIDVFFDVTIHDYYTICPRISLTGTNQQYCGEPSTKQCNACLKLKPHVGANNIEAWRTENEDMLNNAMRVFAPSADSAQRLSRYFGQSNIVLAPHLDIDPKFPVPSAHALQLVGDERLRIVVLGAMSQIKGADILENCAIMADRSNLPLQFHLIGYAYKDLANLPGNVLSVHGEYLDSNLLRLILDARPHLIWFPAQWPETYSYTLSAALMSGLPLVVPDIGAFSERVANRAWSWTCPYNWTPREWNNFFVDIRIAHFVTGKGPVPTGNSQKISLYQYDNYLPINRHLNRSESDWVAIFTILSKHGRLQLNLLEWLVLNCRNILIPLLRITGMEVIVKRLEKYVSPYNRKMIKAWLAGRWPS